jgi:ketosteroid isomerase-like protein
MTNADVAAAIAEHVRAFNERDINALMSGFTDDACWITGSTVARGRAELMKLFTGAMTSLLPTLTIQDLLAAPDRAACQLVERLDVRGEQRMCFIAGFYQFRDGRIASAKIYREGSAEVA